MVIQAIIAQILWNLSKNQTPFEPKCLSRINRCSDFIWKMFERYQTLGLNWIFNLDRILVSLYKKNCHGITSINNELINWKFLWKVILMLYANLFMLLYEFFAIVLSIYQNLKLPLKNCFPNFSDLSKNIPKQPLTGSGNLSRHKLLENYVYMILFTRSVYDQCLRSTWRLEKLYVICMQIL